MKRGREEITIGMIMERNNVPKILRFTQYYFD
jgi:hypothetical protein